jgi:large subunit ribosomal protein L10
LLSRAEKEAQVAELKDKFSRATCLYLVDYRGLDVESVNKLRRRVRKEGNGNHEYRVLKNSVLRRATEGSDYAQIAEHFVGLAKILDSFAEENQAFALKGAVVDGAKLGRAEIAKLATLPSLDELRGKLVGLLLAPATKLARLVSEPGAGLARALSARSQQDS